MEKIYWFLVFSVLLIALYLFQFPGVSALEGAALQLTSDTFSYNQPIDKKYTRYGDNIAPHLKWENVPDGTKSLVLIIDDPDAPTPTPWVHAVVYNIDPKLGELKEGMWENVTFGQTDFKGQTGYQGPQPPQGHGVHRYRFKLFALDTVLNVPAGKTKAEILGAIEGKVIDSVELIGTYSA